MNKVHKKVAVNATKEKIRERKIIEVKTVPRWMNTQRTRKRKENRGVLLFLKSTQILNPNPPPPFSKYRHKEGIMTKRGKG